MHFGKIDDNYIKLRHREKGSGFKEGPMIKESDDKLHLCVSKKIFTRM